MKTILILYLLLSVNLALSQTIIGNLKHISNDIGFIFSSVKIDSQIFQCDSSGNFIIKNVFKVDTLDVIPYPQYYRVKIYNISSNYDTLILHNIPLFQKVNKSVPIIHFKTRRASKKYFKKLENSWQIEEEEIIVKIQNYRYVWQGKEIKLEFQNTKDDVIILINLKQ